MLIYRFFKLLFLIPNNNITNPNVVKPWQYRYNYYITMRKNLYKIIGSMATIAAFILSAKNSLAQKVELPSDLQQFATENRLTTEGPQALTVRTIQWILGFLGLVAVIMVIYGGITWMTSAGNEKKITQAKQILTYSVIGLVIILLSWSFVTFIISRLDEFS